MTATGATGGRVWLPRIDYLVGDDKYTKAYCMYCLHETEWIDHGRAVAQIGGHLDDQHQARALR